MRVLITKLATIPMTDRALMSVENSNWSDILVLCSEKCPMTDRYNAHCCSSHMSVWSQHNSLGPIYKGIFARCVICVHISLHKWSCHTFTAGGGGGGGGSFCEPFAQLTVWVLNIFMFIRNWKGMLVFLFYSKHGFYHAASFAYTQYLVV